VDRADDLEVCDRRDRRADRAGSCFVEFGSGSSAKTPILLSELCPAAYVPIDISGSF
jgi:uncharacterized SAM-dependent methyltransferase